jgi:D-isomer specific 2-hydroxyacid dehydrogenase, NAD binding domain
VMGDATARALTGLGYPVSAWTRTSRACPGVACFSGAAQLREFLGRTDILVVLLPLTPQTRGIMNAEVGDREESGRRGPAGEGGGRRARRGLKAQCTTSCRTDRIGRDFGAVATLRSPVRTRRCPGAPKRSCCALGFKACCSGGACWICTPMAHVRFVRLWRNAQTLSWLPAGASLINGARGAHVVEEDLLEALDSGQVSLLPCIATSETRGISIRMHFCRGNCHHVPLGSSRNNGGCQVERRRNVF